MSNKYLKMDLLRFTTAGSVDDGKSTLIGRLLYDSKSIFQDQMDAIETASQKKGEEKVNLALLTDGLRAEREQGITIDVAYRYFATPKGGSLLPILLDIITGIWASGEHRNSSIILLMLETELNKLEDTFIFSRNSTHYLLY